MRINEINILLKYLKHLHELQPIRERERIDNLDTYRRRVWRSEVTDQKKLRKVPCLKAQDGMAARGRF